MIKEMKKEVFQDWQNSFPNLTSYKQNKLYKLVGPILVGIELIKLPRTEEYRPHFVAYPLWKKNINECLDYPFILQEFYNKKGMQYSIPFDKHNDLFATVLESVARQTPFSFDNDVPLKKMTSVIDEYSKMPPLSAAPNSYLQAILQEAKMNVTLFVSASEAQSVFEKINSRDWDLNHFRACGADPKRWLNSLQSAIYNRDEFLSQIDANKRDKRISNLKHSRLIA